MQSAEERVGDDETRLRWIEHVSNILESVRIICWDRVDHGSGGSNVEVYMHLSCSLL